MDHIPGAKERLEACGKGSRRLVGGSRETTKVAVTRFALGLQQSLLQKERKTILLEPELAGRSRSLDLLK